MGRAGQLGQFSRRRQNGQQIHRPSTLWAFIYQRTMSRGTGHCAGEHRAPCRPARASADRHRDPLTIVPGYQTLDAQ